MQVLFQWNDLKSLSPTNAVKICAMNVQNRPFATNDHLVQNPPCWRASSLLFSHRDVKTKRPQPVLPFVIISQCGNNNKLALQHGGFCTTWLFHLIVAKGLFAEFISTLENFDVYPLGFCYFWELRGWEGRKRFCQVYKFQDSTMWGV